MIYCNLTVVELVLYFLILNILSDKIRKIIKEWGTNKLYISINETLYVL